MATYRPCPNCKRPVPLAESEIDDDESHDVGFVQHQARLKAERTRLGVMREA